MRTIGNILWLVLAGWLLAIEFFVAGCVLCITIIGIPFGLQCFKLAGYVLWPYGWTMERRPDAGGLSALGNVLWFVLAGFWIAVSAVMSGIALCVTIIGIPLGIAAFKIAFVALLPFGREKIRTDERMVATA